MRDVIIGSMDFFVHTQKALMRLRRLNYLDELRLPGVECEGADFGEMDSQAPVGAGNH